MSKFIYLYGIGETQTTDGPVELVQDCYLKCEIPDNVIKNGFFPSVIHAYIMYAKDIGLTVTDVLYSKNFKTGLADQLVYSLWPLFYVNNSEQFTANSGQHGMPVWEITTQNKTTINTKLAYSVHLNTTHGYFYRDPSHVGLANSFNNKSTTQSCPTPAPGNSVTMDVASAWNLNLPSPEQGGGDATSYAIIQHYNEWVVWNTLLNMQKLLDTPVLNKQYHGLRQATGQVLSAVVERPYAYDALVPKWSSSWPDKPDYYEDMRTSMNNYNIGASLFESSPSADPQVSTLH